MLRDIAGIVLCYIGGLFLGNLLLVPVMGAMSLALFLFGMVIALPLMLITIVVFIALRRPILRHPARACAIAPVLVTIGWIILLWRDEGASRELGLWEFLFTAVPWDLIGIGTLCATCASWLYWHWLRRFHSSRRLAP